jgi:aspartate 1-decarboxylase
MANGERFETYVIYGPAGSGVIELNGATALLGKPGDRITIMSFAWLDAAAAAVHEPAVIVLDGENRVARG